MAHALVLGRSLTAGAAATDSQHYAFRCELAITMRIPPAPQHRVFACPCSLRPPPYSYAYLSSRTLPQRPRRLTPSLATDKFKPASIAADDVGALSTREEGRRVELTFPATDRHAEPHRFKGECKVPKSTECVLIQEGDTFRLERLAGITNLTHERSCDAGNIASSSSSSSGAEQASKRRRTQLSSSGAKPSGEGALTTGAWAVGISGVCWAQWVIRRR